MGQMSTDEAIRTYEQILNDPYSSAQQKAMAEMIIKALRGY